MADEDVLLPNKGKPVEPLAPPAEGGEEPSSTGPTGQAPVEQSESLTSAPALGEGPPSIKFEGPPLPEDSVSPEESFSEGVPLKPPEETLEVEEPLAKEESQLAEETAIKAASVFEKKSSWQKILLLAAGAILIGGLVLVLIRFLGPKLSGLIFKPKEVSLTYWGLWEPEGVMQPLIEEFQKENPQIKIQYLKQSPTNYRERLQAALAKNEGPDIFRIHNTWLPMLKNELSALPEEIMSGAEFEASFYPVASQTLRWQDKIYALPLMYDGLALFINEEIFSSGGETAPTDWIELREKATKLTVYDESGAIEIAGAALGATSNIDHWSDILGLMILQNGGSLERSTTELTEDTLEYYTLFSRVDHVWDETLPPSTYAFASGKLAMYFGPSWRAFNIKEINPSLRFRTAPFPQLSEKKVNWATFWAEAVSTDSENKEAAWQFLKFLTKKESLQKLYELESKLRTFGELYPRREMADLLKGDTLAASFLEGAGTARSWYVCSRTFDNGINDRIIKYWEDAVNKVLQGESASSALTTASQGIGQVLSQYGL